MRLKSRLQKLEQRAGKGRGVLTLVSGRQIGDEFIPTGEKKTFAIDGPNLTVRIMFFSATEKAVNRHQKLENPQ